MPACATSAGAPFATNTARLEAGTPYFRIDFGPTNLPHESGVLASRVSFTKGCYPGQEVVARIASDSTLNKVGSLAVFAVRRADHVFETFYDGDVQKALDTAADDIADDIAGLSAAGLAGCSIAFFAFADAPRKGPTDLPSVRPPTAQRSKLVLRMNWRGSMIR